jgi:hypothetical protein
MTAEKENMRTKIIIAIGTFLLFWVNAALAQDQDFTIGKKKQTAVEPVKKASEPKPTWHADTQTFSCPEGYSVYADEKEAGAGKLFVHCMKVKSVAQAQPQILASPVAASPTPAKPRLPDKLTYEEAIQYIQAASASGQNGTDSSPDPIGKKNLNPSFARAASKALLSLSIGQPKDADPWIGAARDLADSGAGGVPENAALLALMNIEREIYDRNLLGKRFDKEECIQGMYVQLHLRHFWSVPVACK